MPRTLTVSRSSNSKLGRMAATYRTADTCPSYCPLMGSGCYAAGRIFSIPERTGQEGNGALLALRETLPTGGALRANVCGDLLDTSGRLDSEHAAALSAVALDRPDVAVWTYTHAWPELRPDAVPGVTVNASAESVDGIRAARAAGWPVVVVDTAEHPLAGSTVDGVRVVACPATVRDGVTCESCRLCALPARSTRTGRPRPIVSFRVHGPAHKRAAAVVAAAG